MMSPEARLPTPELRHPQPPPTVARDALLGVLRTADQLKRRVLEVLENQGVSSQQYNVLRILRGAGERGIPTLEIGERMIEQSPGITRLIDRLEERGWADRLRCAEDRRVVYCRITERGLALLEVLDQPMVEIETVLMAPLAEAEQHVLIGLLNRVRAEPADRNCDGELITPG